MSHKSAKRARQLAREVSGDSRRFVDLFTQAARECGATRAEASAAADNLAQALRQAPDAAAKLLEEGPAQWGRKP